MKGTFSRRDSVLRVGLGWRASRSAGFLLGVTNNGVGEVATVDPAASHDDTCSELRVSL